MSRIHPVLPALLFLASVLLFAGGCSDPKKDEVNSASGEPEDGRIQLVSESDVVESAKRYMRIYFQRIERVDGVSTVEQEKAYFTDGVFKPWTEFDGKLQRWAVSFSNGLNSFVIEMNADATLGGLVTSTTDIPEIQSGSATGSDNYSRVPLVGITEFREAVQTMIVMKPK